MAYEWIVDALEATWDSVDRVLRDRPAEAYLVATPCPGWSVQDVLAHLLGFESALNGEPAPEFTGPYPEYVRNDIGRLNEAYVAYYRDASGPDVLARFRKATATSLERLRGLSDEAWEAIGWSPEGDRPYHRFMETRVLDSWIHLQDIRDALLEPADDHGPGEEIVVNRFEAALPYVVGKRMSAPEGFRLRLNVSGRAGRSVTVAVEDGRARAVPSVDGEVAVEVTTPVALFWRRAAGRITADAFLRASATDVRGDREAARAFAEGLAIMI